MSPKRDIRLGEQVLRRQPPVVGVWCTPPASKNTDRAGCGHPSPACKGASENCELCGWSFCQSHFPRHKRRFECPIDIWRTFDARRRAWYERVQANPKARPQVDVHFPDAEAAEGGADG